MAICQWISGNFDIFFNEIFCFLWCNWFKVTIGLDGLAINKPWYKVMIGQFRGGGSAGWSRGVCVCVCVCVGGGGGAGWSWEGPGWVGWWWVSIKSMSYILMAQYKTDVSQLEILYCYFKCCHMQHMKPNHDVAQLCIAPNGTYFCYLLDLNGKDRNA